MKRLTILSSIAVLALSLTACGKTPDKVVDVQGTTDQATQDLVKDATRQLNAACTGLNQYVYDLVKKTWSASVVNGAGNAYNYHTEKWGWNKWVEITVQVSPKAKDLPKEWNAPGQVLTYELGGGKTPGISTSDKLSQLMCGSMAVSNDPDDPYSHLDVAGLSSLDKLP
jgi:hypothetical protein